MEYSVVYSKRKTVSISVNKCSVIVKAPLGTKDDVIKKLVLKHAGWIEKNLEHQIKKAQMFDGLASQDINELKKHARVYFAERIEHFANIMGLKYGRITITSAQKRFGSCSSQGNICFSYRLMLYPEKAREYVVVHELAHLIHMNHSKEFYGVIESVLPDYRQRKRMLR